MSKFITLKNIIFVTFITIYIFSACMGSSAERTIATGRSIQFHEIWGYLMSGEEKALKGNEPFTDIGFFGASILENGRLKYSSKTPDIRLKNGTTPRVHLVVFELTNSWLLHRCLDASLPQRKALMEDIVAKSASFSGIQLDFEAIPSGDAAPFLDFLRELKSRLGPEKILSVAIPPRRFAVNDAYPYPAIAGIVDRVIIMAYDQHWSTSEPGPIASLPWCRDIATYASTTIPPEKLIMGLPLYGRAWQRHTMNRALRFAEVEKIIKNRKARPRYDRDRGPYLEYREKVPVRIYYDDTASILDKLEMYNTIGVSRVSFWRIGQEPKQLWNHLRAAEEMKPVAVNPPFERRQVLDSALVPPGSLPAGKARP